MNLYLEALLVGFSLAVIGFVVSLIIMYLTSKNFTLAKYVFWKSVVFSYFLTGFLGHLLFQVTGVNKLYCKYGLACTK